MALRDKFLSINFRLCPHPGTIRNLISLANSFTIFFYVFFSVPFFISQFIFSERILFFIKKDVRSRLKPFFLSHRNGNTTRMETFSNSNLYCFTTFLFSSFSLRCQRVRWKDENMIFRMQLTSDAVYGALAWDIVRPFSWIHHSLSFGAGFSWFPASLSANHNKRLWREKCISISRHCSVSMSQRAH